MVVMDAAEREITDISGLQAAVAVLPPPTEDPWAPRQR
jgi:hypothetical protein